MLIKCSDLLWVLQALRCSISCSSYRYFGESACQYFTTLTADKLLRVCVKGVSSIQSYIENIFHF